MESFFQDIVIPVAESAKQWKTAQMESALEAALDLLESGELSRSEFVRVVKKLSNISALRQDFEKAGIIPAKQGSNWLAKLASKD